MNDSIKILETVDCDTNQLYGPLPDAIQYLKEVYEKYPEATLQEHWTGYEDMEMRFVWFRKETAEEIKARIAKEKRQAALNEQLRNKEARREARRKEYLKLKREFG